MISTSFQPPLVFSLEFQPVIIVSMGGREPSGDSGQNVLSVRNVIILLTTWIITHNLNRTAVFSKLSYILVGKAPMNILYPHSIRRQKSMPRVTRRLSPSHAYNENRLEFETTLVVAYSFTYTMVSFLSHHQIFTNTHINFVVIYSLDWMHCSQLRHELGYM